MVKSVTNGKEGHVSSRYETSEKKKNDYSNQKQGKNKTSVNTVNQYDSSSETEYAFHRNSNLENMSVPVKADEQTFDFVIDNEALVY